MWSNEKHKIYISVLKEIKTIHVDKASANRNKRLICAELDLPSWPLFFCASFMHIAHEQM